MILKLKSPQAQFPAGGFPFKDARTGFEVKGVAAYEQTAHGLAHKIIKNRRANPHLYSANEAQWFDTESVVQEIYQLKKSTHPELFVNHSATLPTPATPASSPTCKFCGSSDVETIYCATCGNRKVKRYHCKKCSKEWRP